MPTPRAYLSSPNPDLNIKTLTTSSTNQYDWEPVEGYELWDDFNYATLMGSYGDFLDRDHNAEVLPSVDELLPIEKEIWSERELEQDPLKRDVLAKVNFTIIAAYRYLKFKEDPPTIVCGTKGSYAGFTSDWIGEQRGHRDPFLCGETKLSTVFFMQNTLDAVDHGLDTPVEQCLSYCIRKGTRFGFMISDREMVALRIRAEAIGDGIASQRSRRVIPPARYSYGSSSLASGSQDISMHSDSKPQGSPKWVQYRIIPWSATQDLTIRLALFWITMMAYAPDCDIDMQDRYQPLNRWELVVDDGIYQNNTSGRRRTALKKGHVELVDWKEYEDDNGRKYFASYKGTTYIQEFWDANSQCLYYYDNYTVTSSFDKPQGNLPSLFYNALC
jgi:hypothetical protein